jgi:ABC-2 type transport system ATP-binding protein
MTTEHLTAPVSEATGTAVTLRGLRKSFGDVIAVDGVDLVVAPGEVVALLGPNGAGKTTTIEMLLGLRQPDGGIARVFDLDPHEAVRTGRVGAMMQTGGLVGDVSVREVVHLIASMHSAPLTVARALELAGISDLANRKIKTLSGGQRQRVLFALAVVPDPDLIVLDEPTVAMDVESRHAFWATMREFASRGKTVLFATHYLEEADDFADRVVLMAAGRVVADGPPTEIKAMVGTRTIRATLPDAPIEELERLPGVTRAELRGESVVLACTDSDAAIRALLARFPEARDIEISGAGLEEAFLELTAA